MSTFKIQGIKTSQSKLLATIFSDSPIYNTTYGASHGLPPSELLTTDGAIVTLEQVIESLVGASSKETPSVLLAKTPFQTLPAKNQFPGNGISQVDYEGALKFNAAPTITAYIPNLMAAGATKGKFNVPFDLIAKNVDGIPKDLVPIEMILDGGQIIPMDPNSHITHIASSQFGTGNGAKSDYKSTVKSLLGMTHDAIGDGTYKVTTTVVADDAADNAGGGADPGAA